MQDQVEPELASAGPVGAQPHTRGSLPGYSQKSPVWLSQATSVVIPELGSGQVLLLPVQNHRLFMHAQPTLSAYMQAVPRRFVQSV